MNFFWIVRLKPKSIGKIVFNLEIRILSLLKLTASKFKVRDSHEFHESALINEMNY